MTSRDARPQVVAVSRDDRHGFSKPPADEIRLLVGLGIEGDAHAGVTVQHLSRIKRDPTQPNLRQVHLIHAELHDELTAAGFTVGPGDLGENITTRGVDLLGLPVGTVLRFGERAEVEVTGLRNPCLQLDRLERGLLAANLDKDADGNVVRKTGVMGVVLVGGLVRPGDHVEVLLPSEPREALSPV